MSVITKNVVTINSKALTINDVVNIAKHNYSVILSKDAIQNIKQGREIVEKVLLENKTVYGVNTGFGAFCKEIISKENIRQLQKNLLLSHATGVDKPFNEETVRAIMLLRANTLASGNCGVRLELVQTLLDMLNAGIHPYIPQKGSVGASGDLAPLAHMALVLIGEGQAYYRGNLVSGKEAMKLANIKTLELEAKEGLSLINGTQVMTGVAALITHKAEIIMKTADIISASTIDVLKGSDAAFNKRLHELRPHPGQLKSADNISLVIKNSQIRESHRGCDHVQDAYSMRCTPQVHGASRDTLVHVKKVIEIEINSVTDNPILFLDTEEFLSGGNFHGQPVALVMDYLSIALSEIANISERRIERMVNSKLSEHLPPFLVKDGGINSGFMITQYTAASLVSENKVLAHPASVDSIPTSANQEDHVSMGTIAARKAREILSNIEYVLAIELLCAMQALDFMRELKSGDGIEIIYKLVREKVSYLDKDRPLHTDINILKDMISSGIVLKRVEEQLGELE